MSIVQTQTTSFLAELYQGIHVFGTDTFYIALYDANASLGPATTEYTPANEITGGSYVAGGQALTGVTVGSSNALNSTGAWVTFDNPVWPGVLSARCALIYNASKANRSVAVLDFGAMRTSVTNFTVVLPPAGATTALIRTRSGA